MKKGIKNTNVVACKLGLALTKVTNYRLKFANEKKQKREKMVKKRKIEVIAAKHQKAKRRISLFGKKKKIIRITLEIKQV